MKIEHIEQNIKSAFFIALAIASVVLIVFIANFYDQKISSLSANWGEFGDYFGGTLNPIFSFFSFIALLATILIQTKQLQTSTEELKLSREELRLTREELARSATAQNESQLALNRQAEIANKAAELDTINFLINLYKNEFNDLLNNFTKTAQDRKTNLQQKIRGLEDIIEETFDELINTKGKV